MNNKKISITNIGRDLDLSNKEGIYHKEKKDSISPLAKYSDIGYHLLSPIIGGVLFGLYLDTKLKTRPTLTLFFLFLGVVLSFYNLYRLLKEIK